MTHPSGLALPSPKDNLSLPPLPYYPIICEILSINKDNKMVKCLYKPQWQGARLFHQHNWHLTTNKMSHIYKLNNIDPIYTSRTYLGVLLDCPQKAFTVHCWHYSSYPRSLKKAKIVF